MAPLSPLAVAVVGLGGISQSVHLPLLARRWDLFRIAALVDLSAQRTQQLAARYGVDPDARFAGVDDLLTARAAGTVRVDAVVLATTGSHAPEVGLLTAAGLPVLAEKPLALGLAELDALERHATAAGRDLTAQLMVGYMKEHDPATARAREELAGTRLRAVTVEVLHPADGAQLGFARLLAPPTDVDPAVLGALTERTHATVHAVVGEGAPADLRTLYTNVLLGSVVHDVALLRHLVGGVDRVDTVTQWGDTLPGSVEVTGTVAGGARLHIGWHFLRDYPDYRETVTFHHETGSVQLRFAVPYLLNAPTELTVVGRAATAGADGGAPGEVRSVHRWNQSEAFEDELVAFHRLATRGERAPSSLAEGRADVEVAQRMLAVLAAGRGVALGGEAGRAGVGLPAAVRA